MFSCVGIWYFCAIDEDWLLFVKSICTDLDSLSFIPQFFVKIAILLTADRSFLVELSTVSPIASESKGSWVPYGGPILGQTDRLTVGRKISLSLNLIEKRRRRMNKT
jgi:hypothetical protein